MSITLQKVRLLTGLTADVVDDDSMSVCMELAEDWCRSKAGRVAPPDSAVALMTVYFLRNHLDLKGVKPSSISMPDLSMSTDIRAMCELAKTTAVEQIKAAIANNGGAVIHLRSGKVGRWH